MTKPWNALPLQAFIAFFSICANTRGVITSLIATVDFSPDSPVSTMTTSEPNTMVMDLTVLPGAPIKLPPPTCFEYNVLYPGPDIQTLVDGRIAKPHLCHQICGQTPGCACWTYLPEVSSCYLKSKSARQKKTYHPSAISGPRVCPASQKSCYETDTDYYGYDEHKFVDHLVGSAENCHLICHAFPRCHFWTWVSSQRNCYLKNEHAPLGRVYAPGSISGPRQCTINLDDVPAEGSDQWYSMHLRYGEGCYHHVDVYVGPDVFVNVTVCEPRDSQSLCQLHPACKNFSFTPLEKTCTLKCTDRNILSSVKSNSARPNFRYAPECALRDVEYYGKILEATPQLSLAACHKQCQLMPRCSAVTFENASQLCSLIQRAGEAQGFVSGPKWCKNVPRHTSGNEDASAAPTREYIDPLGDPVCYYLGVAFAEASFSARQAESAELCQKLCRTQPRCKFFTYFVDSKTCLFYEDEGQRLRHDSAASGPRACDSFPCYYIHVEIYGKNVGKSITDSSAKCQQACQQNRSCSFFTYDTLSKFCLQKVHRGFALGTTSAPLYCGLAEDDITPLLLENSPSGFVIPNSYPSHSPSSSSDGSLDGREESSTGATVNCDFSSSEGYSIKSKSPGPYGRELPAASLQESEGRISPEEDMSGTCSYSKSASLRVDKPNYVGRDKMNQMLAQANFVSSASSSEEESLIVSRNGLMNAILESTEEASSIDLDVVNSLSDGDNRGTFLDDEGAGLYADKWEEPFQLHDSALPDELQNISAEADCLTVGSYYDSPALHDLVARSTVECQANCKAEELCSFFSYFRDSGRCTLHLTAGNKMLKREAVSGPWKCGPDSRSKRCFVLGQYIGKGLNGETFPSASVTECYLLCLAHLSCKFFTYNGRQYTCQLFEKVHMIMKALTSISGPQDCSTTEVNPCFQDGVRCEGQKAAARMVNSAQSCLNACQDDASCNFYSYDKVTKICSLLKNIRKTSRVDSAACGAKHCFPLSFDPSCFHLDAKYVPVSRTLPARSFPECYSLCEDGTTCRLFSFLQDERTCLLHDLETELVDRRSAVAGAPRCTLSYRAEHCLSKYSRYVGETLKSIDEVHTTSECQQECAADLECRFFTYSLDSKTCVLLKSRTQLLRDLRTTSGWRQCPDAEACANGAELDVELYAPFSVQARDLDTCNLYCFQMDECSVAAYDPSTSECHLAPLFGIMPGVLSGPLACNAKTSVMWTSLWGGQRPQESVPSADFCFQDDSIYAGAPVERWTAETAQECQLACQNQLNCRFFSYRWTDGTCYFYATHSSLVTEANFLSAPAWCTPRPIDCIVENLRVYGEPEVQAEAPTAEACRAICRGSPLSTYFSFDLLTAHCTCGYHQKPVRKRDTTFKVCMSYNGSVGLQSLELMQSPAKSLPSKLRKISSTSRANPAGRKNLLVTGA